MNRTHTYINIQNTTNWQVLVCWQLHNCTYAIIYTTKTQLIISTETYFQKFLNYGSHEYSDRNILYQI